MNLQTTLTHNVTLHPVGSAVWLMMVTLVAMEIIACPFSVAQDKKEEGSAILRIEVGKDRSVSVYDMNGKPVVAKPQSISDAMSDSKDKMERSLASDSLSGKAFAAPPEGARQSRDMQLIQVTAASAPNEKGKTSNSLVAAPNLTLYQDAGAINNYSYSSSTHVLVVNSCVLNNGTASAGAFRIGWYLSTSTSLSGAILVTTASQSSLAVNTYANKTASVNLDVVSGLTSGTYYVIVYFDDLFQISELDESDNGWIFTSAFAYPGDQGITVTSPAAGASWTVGTQQTVTWTWQNVTGNVNIKLSTDGGVSFPTSLALNTANDGSETITVPNILSTRCRVRVESVSDGTVFGLNPGNFTIFISGPVPPTNLVASAVSSSQINLTWTDASNNEDGFTVERAPGGTTTFTQIVSLSAGATSYQNTGLSASTSYSYRVRAYNSGGDAYSNTATATTSETTPPTISLAGVTGATLGQPLIVSAYITDNSGVASATLYYRKSGESSFAVAGMTGSGGNYQGTVPASAVTGSGVDYYVKAEDTYGNVARSPATGWSSAEVMVPGSGLVKGAAQPAGSEGTAYRLVSIPLQADRSDAASVLVDDLGGYDNSTWRLFELKADQSYAEYPIISPMTPGKAFWLIVKDGGKVIDTGPGKSVSTSSPYGISLNAQWNLVGNPYPFPIPVNKLSLANNEAVVLRSFEGEWNNPVSSPVTVMEPFVGYALKTSSATTLNVGGDLSAGPLPKNTASGIAWWVGIEGRCGEAVDADNVAMVAEGASRERDEFDMPEPPVIGDYVTVQFPHPEWGEHGEDLCVDARPAVNQGEVWEFQVKTASIRRVELKLTGIEKVPQQYQVWLVDEAVHVRQDIRSKPIYEFGGSGEGKARRFALMIGGAAEVRKLMGTRGLDPASFELLPNFPNPFNPTTTIPFALPVTSHVHLGVYSVLGQEVAVLVDGIVEEGYRTVEFDARNLSTGPYYVRLRAEAVGVKQAFATTRVIVLIK